MKRKKEKKNEIDCFIKDTCYIFKKYKLCIKKKKI